MRTRFLVVLLLLSLLPWLARADVLCDGVDDDANSGLSLLTFGSAATVTFVAVVRPTGAAASGGTECYFGESILVIYQNGGFSGDIGVFRNGNLGGLDRLCGFNYDGTTTVVLPATYTANTLYHLALVHGGGTLTFYVNGVSVGSSSSGNTFGTAGTVRLCAGLARVDNTSYQVLNGRVLEAKVYPVALTAGQIAAEAKSGVHNVITTTPSGLWLLNTCPMGATGDGFSFRDTSGNQRPLTGDDGGNATGLTCQGSSLSYQWGVW